MFLDEAMAAVWCQLPIFYTLLWTYTLRLVCYKTLVSNRLFRHQINGAKVHLRSLNKMSREGNQVLQG